MSRMQRSKGKRGELEAVTRLNEYGADAERLIGQSRDGGPDVDSLFGRFEVKRRACLPAYLQIAEDVRGVLFRQDRGPWLVLLRLDDAGRLMRVERRITDTVKGGE
jgi:Holliday junction resolvase